MNLSSKLTPRILKRKVATAVLVTASVAAFATLGEDGGKKKKSTGSELLPYNAKTFSLRSNYNYKSNNLFSKPERKEYIILNKTVTYQRGNAAFVLPMKKLPLMGKIKFTAAPQKF